MENNKWSAQSEPARALYGTSFARVAHKRLCQWIAGKMLSHVKQRNFLAQFLAEFHWQHVELSQKFPQLFFGTK